MKNQDKITFLEKVGISALKNFYEGNDEGEYHGQEMKNVVYMTIPELKKEFRLFLRRELK